MALRKQGKFAEAVSSYQKLEIKPDFAEAGYQLSITRYQNQVILKGYNLPKIGLVIIFQFGKSI